MKLTSLFFSLGLLTSSVSAIPKVTRGGRYLYSEDGARFYIKGLAYQEQGQNESFFISSYLWRTHLLIGVVNEDPNAPFSEPSTFFDPLAASDACARDLPFLQQLGVNTIRVYSVNSSLNHDDCMNALSNAGIYTMCAYVLFFFRLSFRLT